MSPRVIRIIKSAVFAVVIAMIAFVLAPASSQAIPVHTMNQLSVAPYYDTTQVAPVSAVSHTDADQAPTAPAAGVRHAEARTATVFKDGKTYRVAAVASSTPPFPLSDCAVSPYSIYQGSSFGGRQWCVRSSGSSCLDYFDTYNNLVSYCDISGEWYNIWIVDMSGRYGNLDFPANGSIYIFNSDFSKLLWTSGAGRSAYSDDNKVLLVEGVTSQQTYERLNSPTGTTIWRY